MWSPTPSFSSLCRRRAGGDLLSSYLCFSCCSDGSPRARDGEGRLRGSKERWSAAHRHTHTTKKNNNRADRVERKFPQAHTHRELRKQAVHNSTVSRAAAAAVDACTWQTWERTAQDRTEEGEGEGTKRERCEETGKKISKAEEKIRARRKEKGAGHTVLARDGNSKVRAGRCELKHAD